MNKITGKQRSRRVELDYFRRIDPSIYWKRLLGLAGLVVGLVYAAWAMTSTGATLVSPGPLSLVHSATQAEKCETCHTQFTPIRADSLFGTDPKCIQINNQKCNSTCHRVPDHFAMRTQPDRLALESCSGCHMEHRGKNADLLAVSNNECIRCHSEIESAAVADRTEPRKNVTKFTLDSHPDFRSLAKTDPGTIRFSHIQHMRPGQVPTEEADKLAMKLDRIPLQFQDKYRSRADANGVIQLQCSDCHAADSPLQGLSSTSDAAGGKLSLEQRFFEPIRFEEHCVACHKMPLGIPHRIANTAQLDKELVRFASELVLQQKDSGNPLRLPPGETDPLGEATSKEELQSRLPQIKKALGVSEQCGKCHQMKSSGESLVTPAGLNQQWLKGALFAHGSHQQMDCKSCHEQAYATTAGAVDSSKESKQIMIVGIKSCVDCHLGDASAIAQAAQDGKRDLASGDCIECHRFHTDGVPAAPAAVATHNRSDGIRAQPSLLAQWLNVEPRP